jgi:hypothetical protein
MTILGLVAAFLVIFFPSFALAQDGKVSVSPAVVKIDNLSPGEAAEFKLTIHNKDEAAHVFIFTTFQPPEEERRAGRAEFPNDDWISFSPQKIEVPANYQDNVTVRVAISREQKWADGDWEIWLGVASESSDLLVVKLYVRLLVSTDATIAARFHAGLVAGIVVGIVILGYGGYYYFRRKTKPE